jgi:hypothetical protein
MYVDGTIQMQIESRVKNDSAYKQMKRKRKKINESYLLAIYFYKKHIIRKYFFVGTVLFYDYLFHIYI